MNDNKRILKTGALAVVMTIIFAIFAFRATDWTKGLNSEFIVYGQATAGGGGGGTGGSGGGTVTKVVAQIAAGNYGDVEPRNYGTVIEIVNPNSTAVTVSGNFYNAEYPDPAKNGTPSTLTYATNLTSTPIVTGSFSNLPVAGGAILVLSVGTTPANTPATGTTNWAKITATGTVSIACFFELRHSQNRSLYARVGVPASRGDITTFILPRLREKHVADGSGLADIDTGFALVNTSSSAATLVAAKIFDVNGVQVGTTKSIALSPNQHVADFSSTFFGLTTEASGRQYHYIRVDANPPTLGAVALANEAGVLTSFPIDVLQ